MRKVYVVTTTIVFLCIIPTPSESAQYWANTYGGGSQDYAKTLQPTPDGGYILIAETFSFEPFDKGIWVLKLDPNGSIFWEKTFEQQNVES